ncbi:histidine triad nucleotide-binding 3 [Prunus dulcis]|uniref:Histidine triad nucleotide-binding 3 n=1 Tax=Prunus dulcis TaxID=3755 RepID=A0A4Y1S1V5_PRUDU|nr:histidine triad nucleotide-binding 3 [Prunus dulcis]
MLMLAGFPFSVPYMPGPTPAPARLVPVPGSSCDSGFSNKQQPGDSNKGNLQDNCVFCKIIRGEAPAFKLYEDDICLCILGYKSPESWVRHSLIIPKSHFLFVESHTPDVVAAMCSKVPFISSAIMKATDSGLLSCYIAIRTHIHIIPRKALDCLWASESLQRRPLNLDQEAPRLVDRVREQLSLPDDSEDSKGQGSSLTRN